MTEHALYEELAAGYALHALEPEDEHLLLLHVAGCARCEREVEQHRETAAHLAYGASDTSLPAGLFDRVRAQVEAESGPGVFAEPAPAPVAAAPAVASLDAARRRRSLPRAAALVAAAAAVALVTGLAGSNLALRQDRVQQAVASERLTEAVRTLQDGPGRSVPLLDDDRRVAAVAVMQGDHVSLVVEGLAPNADATTYVLWERGRYGGLVALGTFDVRDGGVEVVRDLPLQHGERDVAAFAITHEDGETAPVRPLVAPVAAGEVQEA